MAFHHAHDDVAAAASTSASHGCTGLCAEKHLTLISHVKAVELAAGLLLFSNLVLVAWVLMLRGDRLWRSGHAPVGLTVIGSFVTWSSTRYAMTIPVFTTGA